MIKNKKENKILIKFSRLIAKIKRNKGISIAITISYIVLSGLIYLSYFENTGFSSLDISDFEIGMVADRDITSNRSIEYIDEKATEIRKTAAKHSVTAVFEKDLEIGKKNLKVYAEFINFIKKIKANTKKISEFKFIVLGNYPTLFDEKDLELLYNSGLLEESFEITSNILKKMYDEGITEMPVLALENLNDSTITIVIRRNEMQSYDTLPIDSIIKFENISGYIKETLKTIKKSDMEKQVLLLAIPFIKPNVLYNVSETEKKLNEALSLVKPVTVTINKNQKILKRGFIINEETYNQLKIYSKEGNYIDFRHFFGALVFLFISIIVSLFLLSGTILDKTLGFNFNLLILISFDFVYVFILFMSKLNIFVMPFSMLPILPVAFFAMLISALISQKVAVCVIFILSLAVFGAADYKILPAFFSILSALAGTALINITGRRMDLVKTAGLLTIAQPLIALSFMIIFNDTAISTAVIFGTAFNGFISGIFVLGFLPILETLLNTPTSFRLMELSDLNSPIMKKMLLTVSGTYNHSMMVATLAETACREIGANPLLARVGAYYHDIGKMEQGEYFVENQTSYNKHLDLNPRLSATVIRSHVKLGVEKARQLRLPQQVIDIISEHHGNGLIYYFYAKAKEQNPDTDPEDFSYPGTPPRSKESAVVMLSDVVEAACRTLEKPSVPRLEKFISELISKKIEAGQLDNSDLTFKEINIIKNSFVKILAGYYHSRIEYPNQNNFDDNDDNDKKQVQKTNESNSQGNIKGNTNG